MSDLRFGRSETNIRMVRTFASFVFGPDHMYIMKELHQLGVASVVTQKRNAIIL